MGAFKSAYLVETTFDKRKMSVSISETDLKLLHTNTIVENKLKITQIIG